MSKTNKKNNLIFTLTLLILILLTGYISYNVFFSFKSLMVINDPENTSIYSSPISKINKVIQVYETVNAYPMFNLLKLSTIQLPLGIGLIGKANPFEQPPSPTQELQELIKNQ